MLSTGALMQEFGVLLLQTGGPEEEALRGERLTLSANGAADGVVLVRVADGTEAFAGEAPLILATGSRVFAWTGSIVASPDVKMGALALAAVALRSEQSSLAVLSTDAAGDRTRRPCGPGMPFAIDGAAAGALVSNG